RGASGEGHRRRLDVAGDADAEIAALPAGRLLLLAEGLVVEDLQGLVQGVSGSDLLELLQAGAGERKVTGAQDVAPAQLHGVDADAARPDVEDHLARRRLAHPRTAVGALPR